MSFECKEGKKVQLCLFGTMTTAAQMSEMRQKGEKESKSKIVYLFFFFEVSEQRYTLIPGLLWQNVESCNEEIRYLALFLACEPEGDPCNIWSLYGWYLAWAGMSGAGVCGECRLSTGTKVVLKYTLSLCQSHDIPAEATYPPSRLCTVVGREVKTRKLIQY